MGNWETVKANGLQMLYRPQHRRQISNRGAWYLTKQPYEGSMFAVEKTPSTSEVEAIFPQYIQHLQLRALQFLS